MERRERTFTFFLTGVEDNDAAILKFLRNKKEYKDAKCVFYKLEYTVPYKDYNGIRDFERVTRYRPFVDPTRKTAVAAIDLSDWIGHEREEYLEIFFKFLHDYDWSFYNYKYVFTVAGADKMKMRDLYKLASQYLYDGKIEEDRTMVDEKEMSSYLSETYAIDTSLADKLSHIFLKNKLKGYGQLNTIMEDFISKMQCNRGGKLTEKQVYESIYEMEDSKIAILFEKDFAEWKEKAGDLEMEGAD